jgi:dipeptidase D
LEKDFGIRLSRISGGMQINAIPREASATFIVPEKHKEMIAANVEKSAGGFAEMYKDADPGLVITCEPAALPEHVFAADCSDKVIASLLLLPNGVQAMSQDMPNIVAASCNIGVMETTEDQVMISCFPRGATADYLKGMEGQIRELASRTGAETRFIQRSPAWAFNSDSVLLKTVVECFEKQNGKKPLVTAVHAGLECGILAEKLPGLDIVAFGPNAFDLHTPDERLSVTSVQRTWEFIKKLLGEL